MHHSRIRKTSVFFQLWDKYGGWPMGAISMIAMGSIFIDFGWWSMADTYLRVTASAWLPWVIPGMPVALLFWMGFKMYPDETKKVIGALGLLAFVVVLLLTILP